ncbi:MAG: ABC transporter ATP-binding protein [Anaerolineae bacterium]|jgi:ABC-2 type transport system ATP-binding protein|nr:ABC transporter ATP-binding protein [Anaerolineae bacterium]
MLIETARLRKEYGELVAVQDLDLSVTEGEVFGFLGPNGAGKTTTVKMLLGLVKPSGGLASVLGRPPGTPEAMRRIGFLPEHFRFPPWLTARDFLDMHARLYGMTAEARRERIPALLDRVGLGGRGRSKLGEYSKGMQQRVGLAQALLNRPALVFLDEPTSGLDPVGRYEVREIIRELRGEGVTVFLNSHYLSEVEVTCDRVAIVKGGRLMRVGTLAELTQGANEVEIEARGLDGETLAGLARWGEVTADAETPVGTRKVTLQMTGDDALPQIAAYVVGRGAQLYALTPQRPSLEELFMRVMAEERA